MKYEYHISRVIYTLPVNECVLQPQNGEHIPWGKKLNTLRNIKDISEHAFVNLSKSY